MGITAAQVKNHPKKPSVRRISRKVRPQVDRHARRAAKDTLQEGCAASSMVSGDRRKLHCAHSTAPIAVESHARAVR